MTRVMITGGTGFLGQAIHNLLTQEGYATYSYDRSHGHDVCDNVVLNDMVNSYRPDAVIHLAGMLGTHELFEVPHQAVDVNVHGTLNVIDQCSRRGVPYVGISMPDAFPSIYTATKIAAHRLADAFGHSMGLRYCHVQAYNAFGPGQAYGPGHPQKIVPTFSRACKERSPMPVWGDGSQGVDLIHADDVARVFGLAIDWVLNPEYASLNGQVFQAGTGHTWSVLEVAELVAYYASVHPLVEFLPMRRGEVATHIVADRPAVNRRRMEVATQLDKTVQWYLERP